MRCVLSSRASHPIPSHPIYYILPADRPFHHNTCSQYRNDYQYMITTCPSPRNHRSTQRQHAAVNAIRTTAVPAHTKKTSLYAPNCITLHIISQLLYRCSVQRNRFEERSPRVRNILISLPLIDLIQSHVQCS